MYDMFLFDTLPQQQSNMASYELAGRKVWLKKPPNVTHGWLTCR